MGTYVLDVPMLYVECPGLVIRSADGKRDAVLLRGPDEGPQAAVASVFLISANDVVVADLSLGYCRFHGIQVRGESPFGVSGFRVHNCRLVNCNQQFIKGSSSEADAVGATDGCIEGCLFEFTAGWAYQSYTGGIDIHKGVNWVVRDNLFRNLRTRANAGWPSTRFTFGNAAAAARKTSWSSATGCLTATGASGLVWQRRGRPRGGPEHHPEQPGVQEPAAGPHTDVGIGLEHALNVQVDNNTVVVLNYWAPIEYRFAGSFEPGVPQQPGERSYPAP